MTFISHQDHRFNQVRPLGKSYVGLVEIVYDTILINEILDAYFSKQDKSFYRLTLSLRKNQKPTQPTKCALLARAVCKHWSLFK